MHIEDFELYKMNVILKRQEEANKLELSDVSVKLCGIYLRSYI